MKLRKWQNECVERALVKYQRVPHFFCLATPGAGKTIMAAELARRMIEDNLIDLVLCFSPSTAVMQGIKDTFSHHLNSRFDALIGAKGASYTYQSMAYLSSDFWGLLEQYKVLVIFDEIHHCAGSNLYNCNSWGEQILANIQGKAKYSLAMSGTPWRTDSAPVALASYCDINNQVRCDYEYGLSEAVRDGVCRNPNIVLIDNDECSIVDADEGQLNFSGFEELLNNKHVSYRSILYDVDAVDYMLKAAHKKLMEIRGYQPSAAGLVVASSIIHAQFIYKRINENFGINAVLVNYLEPNSQELISRFKSTGDLWIVSVGMISEGTDIPRLQVCCHLSQIKTEMYYRQILGRILRKTTRYAEDSWLYTFAEKSLVEYANRVDLDIPDVSVLIKEEIKFDLISGLKIEPELICGGYEKKEGCDVDLEFGDFGLGSNALSEDIILSGGFKASVIKVFDSPF